MFEARSQIILRIIAFIDDRLAAQPSPTSVATAHDGAPSGGVRHLEARRAELVLELDALNAQAQAQKRGELELQVTPVPAASPSLSSACASDCRALRRARAAGGRGPRRDVRRRAGPVPRQGAPVPREPAPVHAMASELAPARREFVPARRFSATSQPPRHDSGTSAPTPALDWWNHYSGSTTAAVDAATTRPPRRDQ